MKTIGLRSSIKLSGPALVVSFALGSSPTSAATIFTTSGTIQQVSRNTAQIAFFANKPFWGPPRRGVGFKLWPADTLFVAMVSAFIPITIDGKKSGFADLKVGQAVIVEYELVVEANMYCAATRIDAHTSPPAKNQSEKGTSRKRQ